MVFSSEDNIFIKNLVLLKGYSSRRLIKEFPQKGWNKNGLDVRTLTPIAYCEPARLSAAH